MMMFFALQRNEVVLAEYELSRILDLLAEFHDPGEDVAVWHGPHVVCVRHPDGRVTWLQPRHRPVGGLAAEVVAA